MIAPRNGRVLVLGAGIGGLVLANRLVDRVPEVVLLERSHRVGGRLASLEMEGCVFDVGPTLITSYLMDLLRTGFGVELETRPITWDVITTPRRIPFRIDRDLRALRDLGQIEGLGAWSVLRGLWRAARWSFARGQEESLGHALEAFGLPPMLETVLVAGIINAGLGPRELASATVQLMRYAHHFVHPRGGSESIARALAARFQERGGTIALGHEVERIDERSDQVVVESRSGTQRHSSNADLVVSNMGPVRTVDMLVHASARVRHRHRTERFTPTQPTTHLLYTIPRHCRRDYLGRSELINYYPHASAQALAAFFQRVRRGENPIEGFHSAFPAWHDDSLCSPTHSPLSFIIATDERVESDDIDRFRDYIEREFTGHLMPSFASHARLVGVFRPRDAIPYYNAPGMVTELGYTPGFKPLDARISERVFLAGAGVVIDLQPSLIQAARSGLAVADQVLEAMHA